MKTKKTPGNKKNGDSPAPRQSSSVDMVDKAIRQAEVKIAKGKRIGQGIGSIRTPAGAGKKK